MSLPNVTVKDPLQRQFLERVKQIVETGEGVRGKPLDRYVRLSDLVTVGLIGIKGSAANRSNIAATDLEPANPQDLTTPPQPSGLVASSGMGSVFLKWDKPDYANHAYTRIYRSTDDNFANAIEHTLATGSLFVDDVPYLVIDTETGAIQGYYYWITFISDAGIEGPPNAVAGVYGKPATDPTYFIDVLSQDGASNAPFFVVDTPTVINGVTVPVGVYIKEAFVADATFGSAKIRDLNVNKLTGAIADFVSANINDAAIGSAKLANVIQSDNFDATNGWQINKAGTAIFNEVVMRGTAESEGYNAASQGWQLLPDGSFTLRGAGGVIKLSTAGVPLNAVVGAGSLAALNSIPNGTYIANAIVDTLHLAGQAVTVPAFSATAGSITLTGAEVTCASVAIDTAGAPVHIRFDCLGSVIGFEDEGSYDSCAIWGYLYRDGVLIKSGEMLVAERQIRLTATVNISFQDNGATGVHTYVVKCRSAGNSFGSPVTVKNRSILVLGVKR